MLNKNARTTSDNKGKVRPDKGSNINIQINFNMKDKAQGFTGKKIDNYVDIEQKSTIKDQVYPKNIEEGKKNKQKNNDNGEKLEKDKAFHTPSKQRTAKVSKNTIEEKTPQKRSLEKRQERSKSTNQKLVKRKNAKSVENIRVGFKNNKKGVSPQSSAEKSKSHSKSSKKMLKSNDSSLKNLFVFSNSGIKNKLKKNQSNNNHQSR